jgi:hypothetical protein
MFAFLGQAIGDGGDRIQHPQTEWRFTQQIRAETRFAGCDALGF